MLPFVVVLHDHHHTAESVAVVVDHRGRLLHVRRRHPYQRDCCKGFAAAAVGVAVVVSVVAAVVDS